MNASYRSCKLVFQLGLAIVLVSIRSGRGETNPACGTPERYDLDGSGVVTPADILALIDGMNGPDPQSPQWDFDGSGEVNQLDIDAYVGGVQPCMGARTTASREPDPGIIAGTPQIVAILTPSAPGPYAPGQQISVTVSMQRADPGVLLRARLIQFDMVLSNPSLGISYPITHPTTESGVIHFWDFSSTPICSMDPALCGTTHFIDPNQYLPPDPIVVIVFIGLSPSDSMQITVPADGTPVQVGRLDVTLPQVPGVYRLDLMNAANLDQNYGAQFYSGFGIPSDPLYVIYRASTGEIVGGILDLTVGMDECVSGAGCLDDGLTCTDDICVDGICQHPAKPSGAPCGNPTPQGVCDLPDVCDSAGICSPNYAMGTVCREQAGECDLADLCNGQSPDCPSDFPAEAGTPCGNQSLQGPCDLPDVCDGAGTCRPNLAQSSVICRPARDDCDQADYCSGDSIDCGPDNLAPAGTLCGNPDPVTVCDLADQCDGLGTCSPNYANVQTLCRAAVGECDIDEFCSGLSPFCPMDMMRDSGTPCSDDADECTDDMCNGAGQCLHNNIAGCRDIPAVSTWGLLVLSLLLIIGAKLQYARPTVSISHRP